MLLCSACNSIYGLFLICHSHIVTRYDMLIRGHLKITAYSDRHSAVDFNSATQVVQWCSFKTRL